MPVSKEPMLQSLFLLLGQEGVGGGGDSEQLRLTSTPLDSLSICVSLFSMSFLSPHAKKNKKQKT